MHIPLKTRLWRLGIGALAGLVFSCCGLAAEQLGPVHPIVEPDMLEEIHRVLREKQKSGELARLQKEGIARSKRSIENPRPVEGLVRADRNRTFYFDPSFRAPETIKDSEGRVVAEAGKVVNPLDYVSMSTYMLFVDGTDPKQMAKADALFDHYKGNLKTILVNGPVAELSRARKRQIYFDQGGSLVRKFNLTRVPSLVSQEGKRLRIDELEIKP